MSGRAHRQDLRGLSTTVPKGGVKGAAPDCSPDGKNEDFHGMELRAAAEAKARGDAGPGFGEPWDESSRGKFDPDGNKGMSGAGKEGGLNLPRGGPAPQSGSEILDYQEPMEMETQGKRKRSRSGNR